MPFRSCDYCSTRGQQEGMNCLPLSRLKRRKIHGTTSMSHDSILNRLSVRSRSDPAQLITRLIFALSPRSVSNEVGSSPELIINRSSPDFFCGILGDAAPPWGETIGVTFGARSRSGAGKAIVSRRDLPIGGRTIGTPKRRRDSDSLGTTRKSRLRRLSLREAQDPPMGGTINSSC